MAKTVAESFEDAGRVVDSSRPVDTSKPKSWLDHRYPGYAAKAERWIYTRDHYSGEVLQKLDTYLPQRKIAEHDNAYKERKKIAAYTPHLSLVLDSIAGMLQAVEHDAKRSWHKEDDPAMGLGDPMERGTPAKRLYYNADGKGTNWRTFWNRVAITLLRGRECGIAVEGVTTQAVQGKVITTEPHLRLIEPDAQTNKVMAGTRAVERVLRHIKDSRESVKDDNANEVHYTLFTLTGWEEYKETKGGPVKTNEGSYSYFEDVERQTPTMPIVWIELPMDRDPAYQAARQTNRILNTESEQQMSVRMGNIPWPVFGVKSEPEFQNLLRGIANGQNAVPQRFDASRDHHYMAPPPEPAQISRELIKQYRDDFYRTTFQNFVDSVKAATATEIRQKSRSGIESLLVIMSDALDTAESSVGFLLEQAEFPDQPAMWGHFSVERSKKFQPLDGHELAQWQRDMFFGSESVPLGATGRKNLAVKIAGEAGVVVDPDEVEAEVMERRDRQVQDNDARQAFGI